MGGAAKEATILCTINTLEAEYDIYDRQTWRVPRVKWKGEDHHEKIADPDKVEPHLTIRTTLWYALSGHVISTQFQEWIRR